MSRLVDVTKYDDVIDSRDVIAHIEQLESDRDEWNDDDDNEVQWDIANPDDAELLSQLQVVAEECSGYADWDYGLTLIRYSYWEDYVEEFCKECGYIPDDLPSWIYIDWSRTAHDFGMDYAIVTFDGIDYYFRNC